jgi:hypothetical protein
MGLKKKYSFVVWHVLNATVRLHTHALGVAAEFVHLFMIGCVVLQYAVQTCRSCSLVHLSILRVICQAHACLQVNEFEDLLLYKMLFS